MRNLYMIINQYQRGHEMVLNQLITFRNNRLYFKIKELNQLYKYFSSLDSSNRKESNFLVFLQSIFSSIPLSNFKTNQQIISYMKELLS
ncbi:hypothetical protein [Lysinibacillus sp. BW-2-10]|uniref:hypothetical protein n=1 Tax=Lysinibacillus sp. BW-2-10 TaxID=2590030 RepID=UPI00117D04AE|nr:hypothetical protein [Lysinibacillus sp. BW-2-10]TSI05291.1 hypothetical protein FJQ64_13385 [Lysinibacillus sp. BW-2-10]